VASLLFAFGASPIAASMLIPTPATGARLAMSFAQFARSAEVGAVAASSALVWRLGVAERGMVIEFRLAPSGDLPVAAAVTEPAGSGR
jgi:hypothetical protein